MWEYSTLIPLGIMLITTFISSREEPARFRIITGAHNVKELSGDEQILKVDLIINVSDSLSPPL